MRLHGRNSTAAVGLARDGHPPPGYARLSCFALSSFAMTAPAPHSATPDLTSALPASAPQPHGFLLPVVGGAAVAHLLNDMIQAMLPAIFPQLKTNFALSFGEIGIIALVYQVVASLLQPWIGLYTDKHPK